MTDTTEGFACRYCWHLVREHNLDQGCPHCTCMATPHEGMPQNDAEDTRVPISPQRVPEGKFYRLRKEEDPVPNRTLDRLRADLKHAASAAKMADEAMKIAKMRLVKAEQEERVRQATPPDPPEPGVDRVIKFQVQFDENATVYTYIAWHGPNGGWYLTNSTTHFSWASLLKKMRSDVATRARGGRVRYYIYRNGDTDRDAGWVDQ